MKMNLFKLTLSFLLLGLSSNIFSQNCEPTIVSKDGTLEYFGGKLRDAIGLISDDKSAYSFYVVQVNKGKDGTIVYVSFYESIDSRTAYNNAINDYLNIEKLKSSFIEIVAGNELIRIPSTNCNLVPKTTLGDIYGYDLNFEGSITKKQVIALQENYIDKFKIVIGGKPYERRFKKPTKNTEEIKRVMNCVNIDNIFEVQKKKSEELDLSDVNQSDYSSAIIGKWLMQSSTSILLEFDDSKIIVSNNGQTVSEGTYKISGNRLIYTGTTTTGASNNGVSSFEMFLRDMMILKDKGKEVTYERIQ